MKKAFTLVEMLIVVVIIWILAAALIPRLIGAQSQARDTARKAGIWQISQGLSMALNQEWIIPLPACAEKELLDRKPIITLPWTTQTWTVNWKISDFLSDIPQDPQKWHINYWIRANTVTGWEVNYWANPEGYCKWSYVVRDSYKSWQQWQWYIVSTNMENQKNRNYVISGAYIDHLDDIITGHAARLCDKWVKLVTTAPTSFCETNQVNSWVYVQLWY